MTQNQIRYQETQLKSRENEIRYREHLETQRSNKAREFETARNNLQVAEETRRANLAREYETARSNKAAESETARANRAREFETFRSNTAREAETHRSNLANEFLKRREIDETVRSNLAREAETNRHNVADENLKRADQQVRLQTAQIQSASNISAAALSAEASKYATRMSYLSNMERADIQANTADKDREMQDTISRRDVAKTLYSTAMKADADLERAIISDTTTRRGQDFNSITGLGSSIIKSLPVLW